jgi:hypothetical protein
MDLNPGQILSLALAHDADDVNRSDRHPDQQLSTEVSDLRSHMDSRFDDMRATWHSELRRVEEVLDARLKHLEER